MNSIGSGLREMVGFGTSSSREDQPLAGFEELAMPLFDSLYNFARWIAHGSDDAEDLVQETYLKALRSFASFQPGTNFRAWMFRILRNTFLSSRTKFERRMTETLDSEEDGPELAVETETPETILINRCNSRTGAACHRRSAGALPRDPASLRSGGNVLPGDRGNIVDPVRNRYVPPGQSPEGGSRVTPWCSRCAAIQGLSSSHRNARERRWSLPRGRRQKGRSKAVCCESCKNWISFGWSRNWRKYLIQQCFDA